MDKNTKLLTFFTTILVAAGMGLVTLGLLTAENVSKSQPKSSPPISVKTYEAGPSAVQVQGVTGERAYVDKVIDGDTMDVTIEGSKYKVRFIGVDTPETKDPRRPVGCFGKEAASETKSLIEGRMVILQKDVSSTDRYDRLLRYVYLPVDDSKMIFINDYLVREGYAKVLTYPPDVKFNEQFLEAEKQAREQNRGLWGKCK